MATIDHRDWLEKRLSRAIKEYGPDSGSVKDLKAQIASLGTVRHPSQLAALNSSRNDEYHGSVLAPDSASQEQDPMQPAADPIEAWLKQGARPLNTDEPPKDR